MVREEIIDKLNRFIADHNPIIEESDAVYVMVQMRKLLDHEQDHWQRGSFTRLRFYCDWTVHTDKERITPSMKAVMNEIFADVKNQIMNSGLVSASSVTRFVYMEDLRAEMRRCLEGRGVNLAIVEEGWVSFVGKLVKVLENQPIRNPNENISLFSFLPAAEGCVYGVIQFQQPINGYDHYNFGNAY